MSNFTDEEFIEIINIICKKETSIAQSYVPIQNINDTIDLDRLDSMGIMLFYVWLSEIFELPEEVMEDFVKQEIVTIHMLKNLVEDEGKQNISYAEAIQWTEECI